MRDYIKFAYLDMNSFLDPIFAGSKIKFIDLTIMELNIIEKLKKAENTLATQK